MIRTDLLRGRIAQVGTSQRQVAMALGMTEKTFYAKMKAGRGGPYCGFSLAEVTEMMRVLGIEDPREIFFATGE